MASEPPDDAPDVDHIVAPQTIEQLEGLLSWASAEGAVVLPWGGGTHQGYGPMPDAQVLLRTSALNRVVAYEPEDLTLVVEAGASVRTVETMLAEHNQTALLPEWSSDMTIGGVVAAGVSGWRRYRYGPTRDRMLEATLVTGDGRRIRGGGRVVKNVTGYDLPRLATGSFGSIGVIAEVCLKLWPLHQSTATIRVKDPADALRTAYRPLAVLETVVGTLVYLGGSQAEVDAQASDLGGLRVEGLEWPDKLEVGQGTLWSLRVPPASLSEGLRMLPQSWQFIAQHGVGEAQLADPDFDSATSVELRQWAEALGGALVLEDSVHNIAAILDPWGRPPAMLRAQRRLVAQFDPERVINAGRLPGGI